MSRPALTEPQGDRVLAALERRRDEVHGGNVLAFARELGKSQSAPWQLFTRRRDFLQARLLFSLASVYECTYKAPMPLVAAPALCRYCHRAPSHTPAKVAAAGVTFDSCAACRRGAFDGLAATSRGTEMAPVRVPAPRPAARRAPAMPVPVLEGETSDESIPPMRTPTTAEGLTEALRASVSWASRPAARHAAGRSLSDDAPEIVTPRVHELDRHERALVARRSGRAMRGVS